MTTPLRLDDIGVKGGQIILDFGCGFSTYTISAAKLVGRDEKVYALDISRKALDRMEKKAKQEALKNIVWVDASERERIPLDDEAFDPILLIDIFQEIDDRDVLFDEVYRMLKPDGVVAIYSMYLAEKDVRRSAASRGLFCDRKIWGCVLVFRIIERV